MSKILVIVESPGKIKTLKELKLSFEIIRSKLKPNVLEHLEFTDTHVSFSQTRFQSILGLFYKE